MKVTKSAHHSLFHLILVLVYCMVIMFSYAISQSIIPAVLLTAGILLWANWSSIRNWLTSPRKKKYTRTF